jgi:hypothetical protein
MLKFHKFEKRAENNVLNNGVKIPYQGKISPPTHQRNNIRFFKERVVEENIYVDVGTMLMLHNARLN